MSATVLPEWSKSFGQRAVCINCPLKSWIPEISGHFQLLIFCLFLLSPDSFPLSHARGDRVMGISQKKTTQRNTYTTHLLQNPRSVQEEIGIVVKHLTTLQVLDPQVPGSFPFVPRRGDHPVASLDGVPHALLVADPA